MAKMSHIPFVNFELKCVLFSNHKVKPKTNSLHEQLNILLATPKQYIP